MTTRRAAGKAGWRYRAGQIGQGGGSKSREWPRWGQERCPIRVVGRVSNIHRIRNKGRGLIGVCSNRVKDGRDRRGGAAGGRGSVGRWANWASQG